MELELLDTSNNSASFREKGKPLNMGFISWNTLIKNGEDTYLTNVWGQTTTTENFSEGNIEVELKGEINPTKVFWAVYKVLTKVVCPDCMNTAP